MRALLDVNVLIAVLDEDHSMHERARSWFGANARNGCVRIMSHASYPNPLRVAAIIERLGEATASAPHQFWTDDVSLLDSRVADVPASTGLGR